MKQVEARLIPEWRRQLTPEYKQQKTQEMTMKNLSDSLSRYFASPATQEKRTKDQKPRKLS
jgi:hypothetical protein